METESRKLSILSFLILSALCSYAFYLFLTEVANWLKLGGANVLFGQPWPVVGGTISSVLGLIGFLILSTNQKTTEFTDEVFGELKKVTWPTGKETAASTLVVSVMVIIAAVMFLIMDLIWKAFFEFLI
ncbi:MAG: preprotein translocase subunit SecE [Bdellovibrionota bacterium]